MKSQNVFDAYAEEYEEKFNQNPLGQYQRQQVHRIIAGVISPGDRVLDAGCGPGSDFDFYAAHNIELTALDLSEQMVVYARRKASSLGLNAEVHKQSLLSFESDSKYQVVVLNFGVINAIEDYDAALQKIGDLLAENGRAIMVSMPPMHIFSIMGYLFERRLGTIFQRLIKQLALLPNGMPFFYYRRYHFRKRFRVIKRRSLCPILPNPDQFARSRAWRSFTGIFKPLDHLLAPAWPDILGGDHIVYVLALPKMRNQT